MCMMWARKCWSMPIAMLPGQRNWRSIWGGKCCHGARANPVQFKPAEAARKALAIEGGPVVVADRWDNPGGGVAGDSTLMIEELMQHPHVPAAVGALWDPVAASFRVAAGPGAEMPLRFGG